MALFHFFFAASIAFSALCQSQPHALLDGKTICLELAETQQEKRQGLMYRESLCDNCGMLFINEQEEIATFWMRNTLIPLDMVFIDKNNVVVDIQRAAPCMGMPCPTYVGRAKAKYVLEVKQGTFSNDIVGKKILLWLR